MNCLEKLGIVKKGHTEYISPMTLMKRKHQNSYRICTQFHAKNDRLFKHSCISACFDCIQVTGQSHYKPISAGDLRDAYHTPRLAPGSQNM